MENKIINLRTDQYYSLREDLCFFMSYTTYSKYYGQLNIDMLGNELLNTRYVICTRKEGHDGYYYAMTTQNYLINVMCNENQNFHITKLFFDRDYHAKKKEMYNNKEFLIVIEGGIILDYQKVEHGGIYSNSSQPFPLGTNGHYMTATAMTSLCNAIDDFYEKNNRSADYKEIKSKVGRKFRTQIIQPINDYTKKEQEAEQSNAYGDYMYYNKFQFASNEGGRTRYDFYSTSYDLDSELFSVGSKAAVETIEYINDEKKRTLKGTVKELELEDDCVRMQIEFQGQFDYQILEKEGNIYPQVDETQIKVRRGVVQNIWDGEIASKYMYQLFENYRGGGYESQPGWAEFKSTLKGKNFNGAQLEAIEKGIETKDIQLVLGPPGTGKTTVIVTWVDYFVRQGKRVLISSQNNAAVDNVLERVGQNSGINAVRLGDIEKIQDNCKQYSLDLQAKEKADEYIQRLGKSKKLISADIDTIKNSIEYIDKAKDNYRTKAFYEEQLREYGKQFNSYAKDLKERFDKQNLYRQQYEDYHNQKIHKQVYLYAIKQKSTLYQWIHSRVTRQVEKDVIELKEIEEQVALKYIRSIKEYNALSASFKERLFNDKYQSTYVMIHSLNKQCNTYSFNVILRGPIQEGIMDLPDDIDGAEACDKLELYQRSLRDDINRLNDINKALEDWQDSILSNRTEFVKKLLIQNSNVVGATCIGINSNPWGKELDFDVSIIDECGQILIQDIIVPMTRAPKTLMLGDHMQIPPQVDDKFRDLCEEDGINTELLDESFFEFLFKKLEGKSPYNITRLNEQFRMPEIISDVIGDQFYGGRENYTAHYDMNNWKPMIPGSTSPLIVISTSRQPAWEVRNGRLGRFEKSENPGYSNPLEAKIITNIITDCYTGEPQGVGIISAYAKQVNLIRKELKHESSDFSSEEINSMVASLDSFQGQERPLIIYSLTRSCNKSPDARRIGFLSEIRRLNVAFTRCQRQLIIIGDIDYLTTCKYKKLNKDEEKFSIFLKCIVDQAKKQGQFIELNSTVSSV